MINQSVSTIIPFLEGRNLSVTLDQVTIKKPSTSSKRLMHCSSAPAMVLQGNSNKSCLKSYASPKRDLKRNVGFQSIEIREHRIELGDNPAVSDGVPLTLGWKVLRLTKFDIDTHEIRKAGRKTRGLRIPADLRAFILLQEGHSINEFVTTTIEINEIKQARKESAKNWDLSIGKLLLGKGNRTKFLTSKPKANNAAARGA
jgi:hypothetical protein